MIAILESIFSHFCRQHVMLDDWQMKFIHLVTLHSCAPRMPSLNRLISCHSQNRPLLLPVSYFLLPASPVHKPFPWEVLKMERTRWKSYSKDLHQPIKVSLVSRRLNCRFCFNWNFYWVVNLNFVYNSIKTYEANCFVVWMFWMTWQISIVNFGCLKY